MEIYDCEEIPLKEIIIDPATLTRKSLIHKLANWRCDWVKQISGRAKFPSNVRTDISELANSMKAIGLIQPIGVYPIAYKQWQLIFGLRRLLAAKELGWKTILASILM